LLNLSLHFQERQFINGRQKKKAFFIGKVEYYLMCSVQLQLCGIQIGTKLLGKKFKS